MSSASRSISRGSNLRSSSRRRFPESSHGRSDPSSPAGSDEVTLEAEPDIPGSEHDLVKPFEDWLAHDMQGPGDRPEATFVAVAGDEVIGYAKFSLTSAQPTTAHHDLTGVKRSWRGRGVARALKATQIAWAKAHGYQELRTTNEERNAPIRRLNQAVRLPAVDRLDLPEKVLSPRRAAVKASGRHDDLRHCGAIVR